MLVSEAVSASSFSSSGRAGTVIVQRSPRPRAGLSHLRAGGRSATARLPYSLLFSWNLLLSKLPWPAGIKVVMLLNARVA